MLFFSDKNLVKSQMYSIAKNLILLLRHRFVLIEAIL